MAYSGGVGVGSGGNTNRGTTGLAALAKSAANKQAYRGETKEAWNASFNKAYQNAQRPNGQNMASVGGVQHNAGKGLASHGGIPQKQQVKKPSTPKIYASSNTGLNNPKNPLLNPSQQLSGQSLLDAATALANSADNPTIDQYRQQINQNNANTQATLDKTNQYYQQLANMGNQSTNQTQLIGANLQNQLGVINQNSQNQLQGIANTASQNLNAYAPGGTNTAGMNALATELARQQGLNAQSQAGSQTLGAFQSANATNLAAQNMGTETLRGQERLGQVAQAGNLANYPVEGKLSSAIAKRGSDIETALGKLRQQEITNNLAQQGLGVKQQANQISAQKNTITQQNNTANQKLKGKELSIVQQNDLANQKLRAQANANTAASINERAAASAASTAERAQASAAATAQRAAAANQKAGGKGYLSQSQQNTLLRGIQESEQYIKQLRSSGRSDAQIKQLLNSGQVIRGFPAQDQTTIEAAYEMLGWGHILPGTASALRAMGVNISGRLNVGNPPSVGQSVASTLGSNPF